MADGRVQSKRAKSAYAADAQQHLLPDAHLIVAAVEPGGEAAIVGRVAFDIGIEQVERHLADRQLPDLRPEAAPIDWHLDRDFLTRRIACGRQLLNADVDNGVPLGLPAVGRERLEEVALVVEEPNADERQSEVI